MYNSFVTYYMLAINFSGILAWKLFGDFSSTARHNYPLYLHSVTLIALTFQMQYQKPCDGLNWALPCDQSSVPRGWQQCAYVLFLETCFHSSILKYVDWLFMRRKKKATRVMTTPSTTVRDILLHNKTGLILTCMSTVLFLEKNNRIFTEVIILKSSAKYKWQICTNENNETPNSDFNL